MAGRHARPRPRRVARIRLLPRRGKPPCGQAPPPPPEVALVMFRDALMAWEPSTETRMGD